MKIKNRFKQIGKDSFVYGLGGIIAKSISFFLLPVYTRIFSPADYGTIEMLTVLNGFLSALLNMGMDSAQSFYFFEQKKYGYNAQALVITAILKWRMVWGSLIIIMATLCSPLLNKFFFAGILSWEYFAIAFGVVLFSQLLQQSAEVFRLLYKPWAYISITLSQTLGSAALALFFILILDFGIKGFFIGMFIGSGCAACIGWWRIRGYLVWKDRARLRWPKLLKFGVPLVPTALTMYILNTADRWFINYYHGQEALGIYSVGTKFVMLMVLVVTTFRQAWWPVAMEAMHSEDGKTLFKIIGRLYLGVGIAGVVILTAVSPWLVYCFTAPIYHEAYPIVGILAWYAVFYGFILIGAIGIWKAEKMKIISFLSGVAALLNIILDYLLVPHYGGIGAAIATSISFFTWNLLVLVVSEKLWYVGHSFYIMFLQIILGILAVVSILYIIQNQLNFTILVAITSCTVFVLLLSSLDFKTYRFAFERLKFSYTKNKL